MTTRVLFWRLNLSSIDRSQILTFFQKVGQNFRISRILQGAITSTYQKAYISEGLLLGSSTFACVRAYFISSFPHSTAIRMRPSSPRISNVGILPSKTGQLLALRTKAELNAPFKPTKAYVIEIPTKLAKKTLECVSYI